MHWKFDPTAGKLEHFDGRLIAIVHEIPYGPQLAAVPELFDALDKLTDVSVCIPACTPADEQFQEWLNDLLQATRVGLDALAHARGEL